MEKRKPYLPAIAVLILLSFACGQGTPAVTPTEPPSPPTTAPPATDTPEPPAPTDTPEAPPPTDTPSVPAPTQPLDMNNPQSIVEWLLHAIAQKDMSVVANMVMASNVTYANYIEGGLQKTEQEFLAELEARIHDGLECDFYSVHQGILMVFIDGWAPDWVMDEICYDECLPLDPPWVSSYAGFLFYEDTGAWPLEALWLNEPSIWLDVYGAPRMDCPQ